jgi:hypothetical protein
LMSWFFLTVTLDIRSIFIQDLVISRRMSDSVYASPLQKKNRFMVFSIRSIRRIMEYSPSESFCKTCPAETGKIFVSLVETHANASGKLWDKLSQSPISMKGSRFAYKI